jgi:acyl-CoA dehydrogenase
MDFEYSPRTRELQARLQRFMDDHVYPSERAYEDELAANTAAGRRWSPLQVIEELKPKARDAGLWNLFLPTDTAEASGYHGAGLTNLEYAPLAEIMGRVTWASEVFNCSAPDTGNMETIARYGSEAIKARWLSPLLQGNIRSAFAMTEPDVASSDATNIATRIERQGDEYIINGRKWWTSGAGDPRCAVYITMGKTDPEAPKHAQQSMIVVPADTAGITVVRPLTVMGYDDAPHGHMEVLFENVRVPAENILLGEGRGFEIAQGRLGPGRIHHCMRLIGLAERALELMCRRALGRVAFGKPGRRTDRHARAHRRSPVQDRHGATAHTEGGLDDGRCRQQGSPFGDRDDQGRCTQHGLRGHRLGHSGPWRWRLVPGFSTRQCLRRRPYASFCGRPGRSASERHRQMGTGQVRHIRARCSRSGDPGLLTAPRRRA